MHSVPLKILSGPIYAENKNEDVALFVALDRRRHKNVEFNLASEKNIISDGMILFNSKCNFNPDIPTFPFYVMSQEIFKTDRCYALNGFDKGGETIDPDEIEKEVGLKEKGYVIYPSIGMVSKKGCSGSPIFDKDLNLYGVNVRGVGNTDQLVYVPTEVLNNLYLKNETQIKLFVP